MGFETPDFQQRRRFRNLIHSKGEGSGVPRLWYLKSGCVAQQSGIIQQQLFEPLSMAPDLVSHLCGVVSLLMFFAYFVEGVA